MHVLLIAHCTSLITDDLTIAPAGSGKVNLRFKVPLVEGEGAAIIKGFDDAKKRVVFSLVVKYTAVSHVVSTPKSFLHRSSEDASVSVRLAASLPGYSLAKSEFVPSEGWFVSSSENINGAFELKLKRVATSVQPIGDPYDLQFKSTLLNEVDQQEVGIFQTRLEVRLSDKVRLGPRAPRFEPSSSGASVRLFAIGEAIYDRLPHMVLLLRDRGSNRKTELKISQVEKRGDRTVVFSATIDVGQCSELGRCNESGKELFEIELSDKHGSSAVSVDLVSVLGER